MDIGGSKQLIDQYLDGELDHVGQSRLRDWLEEGPAHVQGFVQRVYLHQQLRQAILAANVDESLKAIGSDATTHVLPLSQQPSPGVSFWQLPAVLIATLFAGMAAGSLATWQIASQKDVNVPFVVHQDAPVAKSGSLELRPYVATLVSATNCRWDKSRSTATLQRGSTLRPGESLHLLEGIAEINSTQQGGGVNTLQLEGPLAMTLTSDGMPSLLYGKLTGTFSSDHDLFALDTPLGRVVVSGDASIGVIAGASDVELHVFSGSATLELWTMGLDKASDQMTAKAGASLRAAVVDNGSVTVERGKSRESWFVTPAAVAESRLVVSDKYVDAVRAARPLAYWRFEKSIDGMMLNEMGDRLHCRMVGEAVRWRSGRDGSTIEFGTTAGPGYLISDDALEGAITDEYTVELWAKPTYYHHGALFSLIDWTPSQSPLGTHRVHLELCGPVSGFPNYLRPNESNPGRIRFINEVSTKFDVECYSADPYSVRKWQHIVALRDPSTMRLYVDGELVDSKPASGTLSKDLRVLMGQLLPVSPKVNDEVTSRLFGGELDEVALYDRALSEEEIAIHVDKRPRKVARPNGAPQGDDD
jgi:hypothetical protein